MKNRTCEILDFAVPTDHRIKLKESEKKDKYHDLAREFKKLWNMKVIIIPFVIGAFGTVTKGLSKGLEDLEVGERVETIQTTALLRRLQCGEESWKLEQSCCHTNSREIPSFNADVKNSREVNNNNINNNDNNNNNNIGIEKCAMLAMKSGKRQLSDRMELPN